MFNPTTTVAGRGRVLKRGPCSSPAKVAAEEGGGAPTIEDTGSSIVLTGADDGNVITAVFSGGLKRFQRTGGLTAGSGFVQNGDDECTYSGSFSGKTVVFNGGAGTDTLMHNAATGDPFSACTSLTLNFKGGTGDRYTYRVSNSPPIDPVDETDVDDSTNLGYMVYYNLD